MKGLGYEFNAERQKRYEELKKEEELKEKKLKAFEIIKVKQVQVNRLNRSHSYKQYNLYLPKEMHLTQEEFGLLKEVLL